MHASDTAADRGDARDVVRDQRAGHDRERLHATRPRDTTRHPVEHKQCRQATTPPQRSGEWAPRRSGPTRQGSYALDRRESSAALLPHDASRSTRPAATRSCSQDATLLSRGRVRAVGARPASRARAVTAARVASSATSRSMKRAVVTKRARVRRLEARLSRGRGALEHETKKERSLGSALGRSCRSGHAANGSRAA